MPSCPYNLGFRVVTQEMEDAPATLFSVEAINDWQFEVCEAILGRKDCVLSIPTGGGKTLAFYLPLFAHWAPGDNEPSHQKVVLIVSPLVELMKEQTADLNSHGIPAVALCAENMVTGDVLAEFGRGQFCVGFASPEITKHPDFHTKVTSRPEVLDSLLFWGFDEAHTILEWRGSFQPDYRDAGGILRGHLPAGLPLLAASATVAPLLLEDLQNTLHIGEAAEIIKFSNARPNVELCVQPILQPKDAFAELSFLVPHEAQRLEDLESTIIYFNDCTEAELACDMLRQHLPAGIPPVAMAFYHRHIRVLMATEALGLGMNLRNIFRVVLWKVPPSFAALVQHAGRAGRVLMECREMVLYIEKSRMRHKGAVTVGGILEAAQLEEITMEEHRPQPALEFPVEGWVEVEGTSTQATGIVGWKRKPSAMEVRDSKYMALFINGTGCRRIAWDDYYENGRKRALPAVSPPSARCCDICEPGHFPIPDIVCESGWPLLKKGRRRKAPPREHDVVRDQLALWRTELVAARWPAKYLVLPVHVLPDEIIEAIASSGTRISSPGELRGCVCWAFMQKFGDLLLEALNEVYRLIDAEYRANVRQQRTWSADGVASTSMAGADGTISDREISRAFNDILHSVKNLQAHSHYLSKDFMAMLPKKLWAYHELIPQPISITLIMRRGQDEKT
ncbi:P-loop containing nucleoside triphosphate hydrolase protein [Gautieria morchelliformis]|nr:P-loop containing nucleoside triphosphate hydrolase protein [Gautieria morchelliformis]